MTIFLMKYIKVKKAFDNKLYFEELSVYPHVICMVVGLLGIWKLRENNQIIGGITSLGLLFNTVFTIQYQYGEMTRKINDEHEYYQKTLPRMVYGISFFMFVLNILYFCIKKKDSENTRYFFLWIFIWKIISLVFLISGPYTQIFYLLHMIIIASVFIILSKTGQSNSYFAFTFYTVLLMNLFFTTKHKLDFMSIKFSRSYIGFPQFSTIAQVGLILSETTGPLLVMFLAVPLVTHFSTKEEEPQIEYDQLQGKKIE